MLARHLGERRRPAEHGPRLRAADHRLPRDELLDGVQLAHLLAESRPRRCRWRSTRRSPSTACSTTAAASGTRASWTASARRPPGLSRRVSAGDRAKLDEYLTSVREVERRVAPMRAEKAAADARADDQGTADPDDAPARQRPAGGHPRAHAADVRPDRHGVPDRQDADRHAPALPRHLGPLLSRSSTSERRTTGPRTTTDRQPTSG